MDFDGTVARADVGYSMVKKYAGPGWEELNKLWEQGVLSTGECAQRTLDLLAVKPGELQAFFEAQEIDPGFPGFIQWLKEQNHDYCIVSDGYDNYIEPILKKYGLMIEYYANHLEYNRGWTISSPHLNPQCARCGTCKSKIIESKCDHESLHVYVGDGHSDKCAAAKCDIVLAKSALAEYCACAGILFHPFEDFYDVQEILIKIMGRGK